MWIQTSNRATGLTTRDEGLQELVASLNLAMEYLSGAVWVGFRDCILSMGGRSPKEVARGQRRELGLKA